MGVSEIHSREALQPFMAMTFPEYRKLLEGFVPRSNVVVIGAEAAGKAVGLLLAQLDTATRQAEILSVFTIKSLRRQGIGRSLFLALEETLSSRMIQSIAVKYTSKAEKHPMDGLLDAMNWPKPSMRMALFEVTIDQLVSAKWVQDFKEDLDRYKIDHWHNVPEIEQARLERADWVPEELAPAKHARQGLDGRACLPELSYALRLEDEIVGWHFTHKIDDKTARYSVSYVRPDLQHDMLLLKLWYFAGIETRKVGFEKIKLGVSIRHRQMLQFCERFLSPLATKVDYSKGAFKLLQQQEEAVWV